MAVDFAFLDSGTGGIPYMLFLKEKSPQSQCVYLGDTIHFPYGEKSVQEITKCAAFAIEKIIKKWNPRSIVVACNTISVTALENLRTLFPSIPIVGTVPAIKLAAKISRNKKIGLLATNATINHPYCKKLIFDFAKDCEIFGRGDPKLVSFIEHKLFFATKKERFFAVEPAVNFFCECDCDTIILGCTHFTHLALEIEQMFSQKNAKKVFVVDSRAGVAKQALKVFAENFQKPQTKTNTTPDMAFFVTQLKSIDEKKEYEKLCAHFGIAFGGSV